MCDVYSLRRIARLLLDAHPEEGEQLRCQVCDARAKRIEGVLIVAIDDL